MAVSTIKRGSKGPNVSTIQQRFNGLNESYAGQFGEGVFAKQAKEFGGNGNPLAVDGIFGPQTEAWVKAFQKHQSDNTGVEQLVADGLVGPKTQAAMATWGIYFS